MLKQEYMYGHVGLMRLGLYKTTPQEETLKRWCTFVEVSVVFWHVGSANGLADFSAVL